MGRDDIVMVPLRADDARWLLAYPNVPFSVADAVRKALAAHDQQPTKSLPAPTEPPKAGIPTMNLLEG